jgi:hypothetical protein
VPLVLLLVPLPLLPPNGPPYEIVLEVKKIRVGSLNPVIISFI